MELKQTPDGKLVLEEKGQGLSADAPKPIMAVVKLTDRGYELRNPANDEYMSGFFKYETGGLTYTGYEVFIPNRNMLGENQKDLFKYFSAKNEYGSNKLPFTDRDVDFVSIAGAKITDKDGNIVSDMYGFSHYDKTMTVLGSTGIDIANASNPLYIEVAGAFVPGVTSNITTTALTKANADAMKAVIEKAGGAVLYGEKETTFGKTSSHSETGGGISESGSGSESGSKSNTDTSAPTLSNVSIASNNTDTTEAEAGDNVTLTFTASEAISTPVVTFKSGGAAINDSSVTYTNTTGNTWTAVYTADASDTLGAVSFRIAFSDKANNAGTVVTNGTGSVTTDRKIDTAGPLFTQFTVKTSEPSLGEKITIEFKATDDTHIGYFNASFSAIGTPNKKINIKAQNKTNTESLSDHFDFSLNSNNFYEVSVPLIIDGELMGGNYKLDSFSASDAKTTKNPNINNESKYGPSVTSAENAKFFKDLSNTDLLVTIPVLESNPGLPVINEQESNATLEQANSIYLIN
jgi:hypothetical protein